MGAQSYGDNDIVIVVTMSYRVRGEAFVAEAGQQQALLRMHQPQLLGYSSLILRVVSAVLKHRAVCAL